MKTSMKKNMVKSKIQFGNFNKFFHSLCLEVVLSSATSFSFYGGKKKRILWFYADYFEFLTIFAQMNMVSNKYKS